MNRPSKNRTRYGGVGPTATWLALAGLLAGTLADVLGQEKDKTGEQPTKLDLKYVPFRVSVHRPDGTPFTDKVKVELKLENDGDTYPMRRSKTPWLYEAMLPPGTYSLQARAGEWLSPVRRVRVGGAKPNAAVYLGKEGWPYYRLGDNVVPFQPRKELVALAYETRKPNPQQILEIVSKLEARLPVARFEFSEKQDLAFTAAEGAIIVLKYTKKPDARERQRILQEMKRIVGGNVRIGIVVDLNPGQVKVLDNRFVVRFRAHVKPDQIEKLAKAVDAKILRRFIQAENARLIEFQSGEYPQHLAAIENWEKQGLLIYGEPDLMAEMTDDAFPCPDAPDDPTFPSQNNLTLQDVDNAWCLLNGIASNLTLGSPNVYVATLDRGVDTNHQDIVGTLTDGSPQLAECYDFSGLRSCTVPGYAPDTDHGMGVYGIIAALTNNNKNIAGIAPNTHQIGLERPSVTSANYPDVLLWAAGFTTGNTSAGWPAEPISRAADIISCSHGATGVALSGIMDDTLTYLATYGRGGKGTLVIYSAGNYAVAITGYRTWAAHPRTLAISNSEQPNSMGVEVLDPKSNYGPEIDICAQGTGARSLNHKGGEQTFGGTSAATPMVAAAAALMLSVEPDLTWINVRDILRATAVMIDAANTDPIGKWVSGFSQWYGFGRLDVDAAVQAANDFDPGQVNLVVRDNLADTGVTVPSGSPFWHSPDIWVRNADPATEGLPDPPYGAAPPHVPAKFGSDNWVRVRVKNVGTADSSNFWVRIYLTHFAGTEFQYPAEYIPSINSGDPIPSPLIPATYLIGQQFVASLGAGAVDIYDFQWPAALVPPETVGGTSWHPCLLTEVSPHTGPTPTGNLVFDNSNLAQRNITIDFAAATGGDGDDDNAEEDDAFTETTLVVGHRESECRFRRLVLHRGSFPKDSRLWIRFLDPRVEESTLRKLREERRPLDPKKPKRHGSCRCCCSRSWHESSRNVTIAVRDGKRVLLLRRGARMELTVVMAGGSLAAVVLGAKLPADRAPGTYSASLVDEGSTGRALGGLELRIHTDQDRDSATVPP